MDKPLVQYYAETREALINLLIALRVEDEDKHNARIAFYEFEGRMFCRFCELGNGHQETCPIGHALAVLAQEKCSRCGSKSVYYHAGPSSFCNACFSS